MALIRPLFSVCPKSADDGFAGSLDRLLAHVPAGPKAPDLVIAEVRKALNWLVITFKINRFTAVPTDVANHLDMIARLADRCIRDRKPTWLAKLRTALNPPDSTSPAIDLAKLIAIEYVACSVQTSVDQPPVSLDGIDARALRLLASLDLDHDGTLQWLAYWARKQRRLILEDQEITAQRLSVVEGVELIEGRPFKFKPDPIKVRYARPSSDCLDDFVGQLCVIYRWAGGSTHVPRDGRPATDFESFLAAVTEVYPEIKQHGSLKTRAISVLREERQGIRTLGFRTDAG